MKTTSVKLPYKISEYIQEHFREDFLFEVKQVKKVKGHTYYIIEVSKDDYIHTLMFNEDGQIVKDEADLAFPPDLHEETGYENIPE